MARRKKVEKETDWVEVDRILETMKDKDVYEQLIALRGKVHLNLDLDDIAELRED